MRSIIRIGTLFCAQYHRNVAVSIPSGIRTVTVPTTISIVGLGTIGIAAPGGADGQASGITHKCAIVLLDVYREADFC